MYLHHLLLRLRSLKYDHHHHHLLVFYRLEKELQLHHLLHLHRLDHLHRIQLHRLHHHQIQLHHLLHHLLQLHYLLHHQLGRVLILQLVPQPHHCLRLHQIQLLLLNLHLQNYLHHLQLELAQVVLAPQILEFQFAQILRGQPLFGLSPTLEQDYFQLY